MEILFVSSSKIPSKFPQRSDHLYRELKLMANIKIIEAHNPFLGIIKVLKNRKIKCKIFSGFRAGLCALFCKPFIKEYIYDLVEWKADLCRDNWKGIKRIFIPLIEFLEIEIIKNSILVFNAGHSLIPPIKINKPIVFAPNGYNSEIFNPLKYNREELRKKYNVNFPLIIYIGKLTNMYVKYLIPVIKSMKIVNKEFPNAEFWIFGEGEGEKELRKYISENVKLKGYIEYKYVPEIITIADIGINAYKTESLKLIEWLSMGLPVIAPKSVKIPGVINCNWNEEEIANKIIKILKNYNRNIVKLNDWKETAEIIFNTCKKIYS